MARCTKIIKSETEDARYIINVKQFAKFVVDLADTVAPTDIEEGMRVGYVNANYKAALMSDVLHPNDAGYAVLANASFQIVGPLAR